MSKGSEIDLDHLEALAAQGLTVKQMADCLGIGRSTLYDHKKARPEVSDAIKRGRSKGIATVSNALFQSAKGGNVTAQIFYLKNRDPDKWRDRRELEHGGSIHQTHEHTAVSEIDRRIEEIFAGREDRDAAETLPH